MQYDKLLNQLYNTIKENEAYLNELDAKNGDGEHGLNLRRSFEYIVSNYKNDNHDLSRFLIKFGILFLSAGGGTAATLYGAAARRMGKELKGKDLNCNTLAESVLAIPDEIKKRGGAEVGQKTMLDAISPGAETFSNTLQKESLVNSLEKAYNEATAGMEKAKDLIGTKGRAYYAGERAKGIKDPGAQSFCLMLNTILIFVKENNIEL